MRQAAAEAEIAELREQAAKLNDAVATAERERDRWGGARETVLALAAEEQPDPAALTRAPRSPPPIHRSSKSSPRPPARYRPRAYAGC